MRFLRLIFLICVLTGAILIPSVYSSETADFLRDLNGLRDPFVPQLPAPRPAPVVPTITSAQNKQNQTQVQPTAQALPIVQHTPAPSAANSQIKRVDANSLIVKGLVWNTDMPQAIINDKIVRVGDVVAGMKILSIRSTGVEVMNNGAKVLINVTEMKKK